MVYGKYKLYHTSIFPFASIKFAFWLLPSQKHTKPGKQKYRSGSSRYLCTLPMQGFKRDITLTGGKQFTLPKTNSLPLKIDAWKTCFLLGPGLFRSVFRIFWCLVPSEDSSMVLHQRDIHNAKHLETQKIHKAKCFKTPPTNILRHLRQWPWSIEALPPTMNCCYLHLHLRLESTSKSANKYCLLLVLLLLLLTTERSSSILHVQDALHRIEIHQKRTSLKILVWCWYLEDHLIS